MMVFDNDDGVDDDDGGDDMFTIRLVGILSLSHRFWRHPAYLPLSVHFILPHPSLTGPMAVDVVCTLSTISCCLDIPKSATCHILQCSQTQINLTFASR